MNGFERGFWLPVVLAVFVHGALAGGVEGARRLGWFDSKKKADVVEIEIIEPPPPKQEPLPPPPPPPPPPPEEKVEQPPLPPPEPKKLAKADPPPKVKAPPPPATAPQPEPPAPGPPADDTAPPAPYTYKMPAQGGGGSMGVQQGAGPTGSAQGKPGGTGKGGGGPPDSTGNAPKVTSVASVKVQPKVLGDFDRFDPKEYPEQAKRAGIEGQVQVRILVDDQGRPAQVKLLKGLGHGLDEKALELAKKLRFKPAIDTEGRSVAVWITWKFNFVLPD